MQLTPVYLGGSRNLEPNHPAYAIAQAVTRSIIRSGVPIHVGCQRGADQAVIWSAMFAPSFLFVFAVAPTLAEAPAVIERAHHAGAAVTLAAGGSEQVSIKARYLRRSLAGLQGCSQAVFFQPGPGSLAVAREAVKRNIPVFAFSTVEPEPIPNTTGTWQLVDYKSYYSAFNTQAVQAYVWQTNPRLF